MKKYIVTLSVILILLPLTTSATLLGWVGGGRQEITPGTGFYRIIRCAISDTDRGTAPDGSYIVVQAAKLADAEAINNLYVAKWHRSANCEELQRHIDWGTSLDRLAEWLVVDQPNSVIGDCGYPRGTTKDAVEKLNNIYREEAGVNMNCNEMLFHLKGTTHDALKNWIRTNSRFSAYQEWKNSFQLTEGATYRDGSKFWLVRNGQRHWVPDVATLFSHGLVFGDSTYITPSFATGFYYMISEGEQLKFWEGRYKTAVVNRFRGSGYGSIPARLEAAIRSYRHPGATWRGWSELHSRGFSSCNQRGEDYTLYCEL